VIYAWIHFLHVVGALGYAAAYAVEAAGLVGLRQSVVADEARIWFRTRRWGLRLGPASLFLVLSSGVYSVLVAWGWAGWIQASMTGLLSVAVVGGLLTGIPTARLAPALERSAGPLSEDLRIKIRAPVLTASLAMRISITLGIVFLMVQKPGRLEAFVVVVSAAALGAVIGWALGMRRPGVTAQPVAAHLTTAPGADTTVDRPERVTRGTLRGN
jgi:hypothetical protein